jgi:hypothetical protein
MPLNDLISREIGQFVLLIVGVPEMDFLVFCAFHHPQIQLKLDVIPLCGHHWVVITYGVLLVLDPFSVHDKVDRRHLDLEVARVGVVGFADEIAQKFFAVRVV